MSGGAQLDDEIRQLWQSYKGLRADVDALKAGKPEPTPEPVLPTSLPRLSMYRGALVENGLPFRDWSVSMTSWAIFDSSDDKLRMFLDDLWDIGCRVLRVLHWYGFEGVSIDGYDERRAVGMDRLFHEWRHKRGGHVWFTPFHRQCYTGPRETVYGPIRVWETLQQHRGAAGIKTEIGDLFLWDDALEGIVTENQTRLLKRVNTLTGTTWADDISILELANEKLSARGYIGDASNLASVEHERNGDGRYQAFLRRMFAYRHASGQSERNKFTLPEVREMLAWNGYHVYSRLRWAAAEAGYNGPVIASSLYGKSTMACLPELMAGDLMGLHLYRTSAKDLPDPFDPASKRNVQTIVNAIRCLPVAIGEVNAADEGAGPTERFLEAPRYVAGCGAELVSWYAAAQASLDRVQPDNVIYNLWARRPDWFKEFALAQPAFHLQQTVGPVHDLTWDEVFGPKGGEPLLPGQQDWAGSVAGVRLPKLWWMDTPAG